MVHGPTPGRASRPRGQGYGPSLSGALDALGAGAPPILGRDLTAQELGLFSKYLDLLRKWQKTQRLVGSVDPAWVVEHLFLDSLLFLKVIPIHARELLDLGAGAGFPGLPLKIVAPALHLTLVESRRRRASFLATVVRELTLEGVRVLNERAEGLLADHADGFDAVVMRCAGRPTRLIPLAARFLRVGGIAIAGGSPTPRAIPLAEWTTVAGVGGRPRRLLIYRKS